MRQTGRTADVTAQCCCCRHHRRNVNPEGLKCYTSRLFAAGPHLQRCRRHLHRKIWPSYTSQAVKQPSPSFHFYDFFPTRKAFRFHTLRLNSPVTHGKRKQGFNGGKNSDTSWENLVKMLENTVARKGRSCRGA